MEIEYAKWREGEGYDLTSMRALSRLELGEVEALLVDHLQRDGDWREDEALAAIDTNSAIAAVLSARKQQITNVRNYAVRLGYISESDVIRAIENAKSMDGLDAALRITEHCITAAVQSVVLHRAQNGDPTLRVHMVAMLFFLMGKAGFAFEWEQRSYFLGFGVVDNQTLLRAWNPLSAELEAFEDRQKK